MVDIPASYFSLSEGMNIVLVFEAAFCFQIWGLYLKKTQFWRFLKNTCQLGKFSNDSRDSHHQDYYIFSDTFKPSFAPVTGRGSISNIVLSYKSVFYLPTSELIRNNWSSVSWSKYCFLHNLSLRMSPCQQVPFCWHPGFDRTGKLV